MKPDFKKVFGHIKNTKTLTVIFILGIVLLMIPAGANEKKGRNQREPDNKLYRIQKWVGRKS